MLGKQTQLPLLLAVVTFLAIDPSSARATIPARLDLVAVDQTTNDLIYEGAFDVYHLMVDAPLEEVYGLQLELSGLDLVSSEATFGTQVRSTPDLPTVLDFVIPESFFVGGRNGFDAYVIQPQQNESLLRGFVLGLGRPLFESRASSMGEQTVAVLTTPAGSPKPELPNLLGAAFVVNRSRLVGSSDLNGDGNVDLLDIDILTRQFHPFGPNPRSSLELSLAADINSDGVVDGRDAVGVGLNFAALGGFPLAYDATSTAIVVDSTFTVSGPFDLLDLDTLGANFGATRATVGQRDLNGDQVVDLIDLDLLGADFQRGARAVGIPEPSAAWLVAVAVLLRGSSRWMRSRQRVTNNGQRFAERSAIMG